MDPHLLVVDDSSPDGAGALADAIAAREARVRVLHRPAKRGLGTAYIEAFRYALDKTDASLVLQMDADFSHDPSAPGSFVEAAEECDVVVGSRHHGGVRVVNWPLRRLASSLAANPYAAAGTDVPIRGLTSGFNCYRRSALEQLPLEAFRSDGYAFQIETVVHAWRRGLRVQELPIVFTDRVNGRSKLGWRVLWEATWIVWSLRFR